MSLLDTIVLCTTSWLLFFLANLHHSLFFCKRGHVVIAKSIVFTFSELVAFFYKFSFISREDYPEAEFLDVIGTKVLRVFLLAIHIHLYYGFYPPSHALSKNCLKLVCNVNIVQYKETSSLRRRLCSETSTKFYVHEFGFCTGGEPQP